MFCRIASDVKRKGEDERKTGGLNGNENLLRRDGLRVLPGRRAMHGENRMPFGSQRHDCMGREAAVSAVQNMAEIAKGRRTGRKGETAS